jgi:putative membrane protein insertion efficiency factor
MNAVQRNLRIAGAPVRMLLIACIKVYRVGLSGWLGGQCRFYPSCSRYAEEAISVHGAIRGSSMALWRVLRCNPFGAGGLDPVHDGRERDPYDDVVRRASEQKARV